MGHSMRIPTYLSLSRHSLYYFRFPLPPKLFGKQMEIKLSLQTRCPQEAIYLSRALAYLGQSIINSQNIANMELQEIKDALIQYFTAIREDVKTRINTVGRLTEQDKRSYANSITHADEALATNTFNKIGNRTDLAKVIKQFDMPINSGDQNYHAMQAMFAHAFRAFSASILELDSRWDKFQFSTEPSYLNIRRATQHRNKQKLVDIYKDYEADKIRTDKWGAASLKGFRAQMKLLIEYLGEDQSIHISHAIAADVKRMLLAIPKNRNSRLHKAKTLHELVALSEGTMSIQNVNKYLSTYNSFYIWAVKHQHTDENNFKMLVEDTKSEQKERARFTNAEIRKILAAVPALARQDSQKWYLFLSIYTGARLAELTQLDLADIKEDGGLWHLDINRNNGKKTKNKASIRIVPIHSKVIEEGFLDYVARCRNNSQTKLFPEANLGRNLGRWVNESFLPALELKKPEIVNHSFRHTLIAELLDSGVEYPKVARIVGHKLQGVTLKTYGKGFKLPLLKEELERLNFFSNG